MLVHRRVRNAQTGGITRKLFFCLLGGIKELRVVMIWETISARIYPSFEAIGNRKKPEEFRAKNLGLQREKP